MCICICTLCGIPASGKSTTSQELLSSETTSFLKTSLNLAHLNVVLISFDLVEKELRASLGISSWTRESWHHARILAIEQIETSISTAKSTQIPTLIIIDDNNLYHSMRQVYKRMAISHKCCYLLVYFTCTLEEALERNLRRNSDVPSESIIKMYNSFEIPTDNSHHFSYCIETNSISDLISYITKAWSLGPPVDLSTITVSVPPSLVGLIENSLRKALTFVFLSLSSDEKRQYQKQLNELKKCCYNDFKSELETVLNDLDGFEIDKDALISNFVFKFLQKVTVETGIVVDLNVACTEVLRVLHGSKAI
ncbi:hypothetical protein RCL1_001050 [Eukaryota sp. TZLM3-RCL]